MVGRAVAAPTVILTSASEVQAGLSFIFKFRTRTIHYWREQTLIKPTPVDKDDNVIMPGLVMSFAIGFVR